MSWSVSFIGKPEKVAEALEKHSASLTGQSKIEFDEAKPHLVALVNNNFNKRAGEQGGGVEPFIQLDASGSGCAQRDEQVQRQVSVTLKSIYGALV
jgi:hypothetical protein